MPILEYYLQIILINCKYDTFNKIDINLNIINLYKYVLINNNDNYFD